MFLKLEKKIYKLVKKNKRLKNALRDIYQILNLPKVFFNKKININSDYIELVHKVDNGYFGFHDRPSMNDYGEVLSHINYTVNCEGLGNASICYTNVNTNENKIITDTKCFNFQQGSLLTWFNNDSIIYNTYSSGKLKTIIRYLNGHIIREFDWHFNALSPNKKYLSSINFLRFGIGLNGYGYDIEYPVNYVIDSKQNIGDKAESDFVIYNIDNIEIYRLSIKDAILQSSGLIDNGYFYFSHSCFSPDSKKVFFLLRSSNEYYNSSQLFVYDLFLNKLEALGTNGMVSHLSWLSNLGIIAFCNVKGSNVDHYYIFNLSDGSINKCDNEWLMVDGHPHGISHNTFITDTYANASRMQKLYFINIADDKVTKLLDIYSPFGFRNNMRVDLHPRLSSCNKYITIDSSYLGYRCQLVFLIK